MIICLFFRIVLYETMMFLCGDVFLTIVDDC